MLHVSELCPPFFEQANLAYITPAPHGSLLVSCCPGLQSLDTRQLWCSAELLGPLTGLSGLRTLLCEAYCDNAQALQVVPRLSGLRELQLCVDNEYRRNRHTEEGLLLLRLNELRQLTRLKFDEVVDGSLGPEYSCIFDLQVCPQLCHWALTGMLP